MSKSDVYTVPLSDEVVSAVHRWSDREIAGNDFTEEQQNYQKYILRKWIFLAVCVAVIVIVAGYAITIGSYGIGFLESYQTIWNHITGDIADVTKDHVVVQLRTPRIVVAIIAGAGLAVAGVVMQSTLLNPLADPYTTGISSGASFGASLAVVCGISMVGGRYGLVFNAFLFSLIPMIAIVTVAKAKNSSPTVMIMAGIAIMYIFNAMTTVLKLWADPNSLQELFEWQVGSVSSCKWDDIPIMLVITVVGIVIVQIMSRKLNVLATGEDNANALGIDASKLRTMLLILVSLMTAAIVSFVGLIGFVGLVAPHIARIFVGADNRYLVVCSAALGSALLIVGDLVGRLIIYPSTIQAGVIMAFLGGPMFLWLIMRRKSQVWS